jgi:hypothetical protein
MHRILIRGEGINNEEDGADSSSKKEAISERFGFLTRSLVKNNVVK